MTDTDELLTGLYRLVEIFNEQSIPGYWLVDSLPVLQYLPKWFPGCRAFNDVVDESQNSMERLVVVPKSFAEDKMVLCQLISPVSDDTNLYTRTTTHHAFRLSYYPTLAFVARRMISRLLLQTYI